MAPPLGAPADWGRALVLGNQTERERFWSTFAGAYAKALGLPRQSIRIQGSTFSSAGLGSAAAGAARAAFAAPGAALQQESARRPPAAQQQQQQQQQQPIPSRRRRQLYQQAGAAAAPPVKIVTQFFADVPTAPNPSIPTHTTDPESLLEDTRAQIERSSQYILAPPLEAEFSRPGGVVVATPRRFPGPPQAPAAPAPAPQQPPRREPAPAPAPPSPDAPGDAGPRAPAAPRAQAPRERLAPQEEFLRQRLEEELRPPPPPPPARAAPRLPPFKDDGSPSLVAPGALAAPPTWTEADLRDPRWVGAPRCPGEPSPSVGVEADTVGRLWGWRDDRSCAFKDGGGAPIMGDLLGAWVSWENAPRCGGARATENSVLDTQGRWWGWELSRSCKFEAGAS
ncbi:MAG: hypothetical protein J3K34DRAFT_456270 [Monoraphidium minutum]|nr:MAG: hypothetical protein J3K34DRAFT_456270 [Monoraphidium minutum]